jgi:hypothetical protein
VHGEATSSELRTGCSPRYSRASRATSLKGDLLLRLDDTPNASKAGEVEAQSRALRAQIVRLEAEEKGDASKSYTLSSIIFRMTSEMRSARLAIARSFPSMSPVSGFMASRAPGWRRDRGTELVRGLGCSPKGSSWVMSENDLSRPDRDLGKRQRNGGNRLSFSPLTAPLLRRRRAR